jgi:hypothetical protein
MAHVPPPTKHQLALMIWVAVFPTLTALNVVLGDTLAGVPGIVRTFVLATVAVPIVIYGVMPRLHGIRARIITARGGEAPRGFGGWSREEPSGRRGPAAKGGLPRAGEIPCETKTRNRAGPTDPLVGDESLVRPAQPGPTNDSVTCRSS